MKCPNCQNDNNKVVNTVRLKTGNVRRYRRCLSCGNKFVTIETIRREKDDKGN